MKRWSWIGLAILAVALIAASNVIETGPPRLGEFLLTAGDAVTSDSLSNWSKVTSVILDNTGAATGEVGLYTSAGWTEIEIEGDRVLNLGLEFETMSNISSATTKPDTVIMSVSGTFRVYPAGH